MPSQSLSLSQSQRLQMMLAPQLRQSLEMLQVPIQELRAMIQKEIEQNPTIEEGPDNRESVEIEPGTGEVNEKENREELNFDKEIEALSKLDEEWRDYFIQDAHARPFTTEDEERRQFMLDSLQQQESLQEHLLSQLKTAGLSEADRQIGELLIGSINDDGYLTGTLEDLALSVGTDASHLGDILDIVQEFHPTGVGARDLRECLQLQLARVGNTDPTVAA
ncbi:MAG: RNA polymerase sigma-54 factor, partial [Verrucomicrobia bacterium]|nr:RNA polymerase sigma-54 factor [Verrucomicrobiota bacterium]